MKESSPSAIYLKDYQVPNFLIDKTELTFELDEASVVVTARLHMRRNSASNDQSASLALDGGEDMKLIGVAIDNNPLASKDYQLTSQQLEIFTVPDEFVLTCETLIEPQNNTRLEGLYRSSSMFCTQCEAEGFRHITYYLDRPDVMSVFTTTIIADENKYPVMLSNGNEVERGMTEDGRTVVTWHDPFKKPAYLFALVAGDLAVQDDVFKTKSGRAVTLRIFTEQHNIDKVDYAMGALKRSMKWDEEAYGREYDLDIFMVVAVDDFNMGAMENKGLNIFNSSCLLASPETTTDDAYLRIEAIVAHEYFHNWSGNRVTCRDWFQLSLKEGFTVFRDQTFSSDMHSETVKRVEDVSFLRTAQFAEDAGPMAHPVRPASFIEISNFYTLTVYEKGAEIVRMIHTLLGEKCFRKGADLYFERHDGQAVTCDDFVTAMEDASGIDLSQFKRWYSQAGTPELVLSSEYSESSKTFTLTVQQTTQPTPGQDTKLPLHIPIKLGLISHDGKELKSTYDDCREREHVLHLKGEKTVFEFFNVESKPVPSILRGFSAPVKVEYGYSTEELLLLMSCDSDGFNRWDAGQQLAVRELKALIDQVKNSETLIESSDLVSGYKALLLNEELDPAMVALILTLPSQAYLSELEAEIDPQAIYTARDHLTKVIAKALQNEFSSVYSQNTEETVYEPNAAQIAKRALKNTALRYWVESGDVKALEALTEQFANSDNMTDQYAALAIAVEANIDKADSMLATFYDQWLHESLVVNKWLTLSACKEDRKGLEKVNELMSHPAFDIKNPNKVRAVLGGMSRSVQVFHNEDGSGYRYLADQIIYLNKRNPQLASRMCTPLTRWKKYKSILSGLMKSELIRIQKEELSKDVYEVITKSLEG
ncbi:aminopeptidase N [Marinomonas mediterranea]|jgi:aminopeptidase N, Escherichia coli type|uniref:Aminopeptidase N n=1 Tax=Marinomonas mediterranea (strain ATCC 700492 / JCM 21426 / NBRC 103028 / MMB-1) TaxID=717774 RepID=F2K3F9_MARM1|nr:aminopeptidase N [Marinomonas mediterranea]ADZ91301.1 aminopeptidase N [Marinomonas mediterranea MMB-1]WCN09272.1 aminopeptidase N [Marinomonas mediterranea]WCN13354.1 aminopeptidase N [Marinomonas mediterranea]WCN17422.1 aminopeptidase N [Marinomonas mediterranea MMB-1]